LAELKDFEVQRNKLSNNLTSKISDISTFRKVAKMLEEFIEGAQEKT
jgi:hypothetical protein